MLGNNIAPRRRVCIQLCVLAIIPVCLFLLYAWHTEQLDLSSVSTSSVQDWRDRIADAARHGPLSFGGLQTQPAGARRCGMCDVNPDLCEREGRDKVIRSVTFQGTNKRLRRVLRKMRSGEPWVMGVIGGSVSTGQGSQYRNPKINPPFHPKYQLTNMHRVAFDKLDSLFPSADPAVLESILAAEANITPEQLAANATFLDLASLAMNLNTNVSDISKPFSRAYGFSAREKGVNSMVNGAQGATGSDYFSYCYGEHIPEDVDLVMVELAVNDGFHGGTLESYEQLLRALLDLPKKPAVIAIESMALQADTMIKGGDLHKGLNEYYDIPSISVRAAYLHAVMDASGPSVIDTFFIREHRRGDAHLGGLPVQMSDIDMGHLSPSMHIKAGNLIAAYIDTQVCEIEVEDQLKGVEYNNAQGAEPLPRLALDSRFDLSTHLPPFRPFCNSTTSLLHPLTPSFSDGWVPWAWKEKKFLMANTTDARISFAVKVQQDPGVVNVIFQRSSEFGLGNVQCWLEGEMKGWTRATLEGWWSSMYNVLQTHTFKNIPPGEHVLTCKVLEQTADPGGGHEFRIASVTRSVLPLYIDDLACNDKRSTMEARRGMKRSLEQVHALTDPASESSLGGLYRSGAYAEV